MDEIRLTRDADALICVLYKEYLQRRKSGKSKYTALRFGGSPAIHESLMPKWSFEDVDETCRELSRVHFLSCLYADGIVYDAILTDSAVIYMENRFKDGLGSLLNHISDLASLLPWQLSV